ncbi:MAG: glutaredoxin family protein [Gammaproteobacteria bacterium]|nr:glutaredoxin family protein [Gammaproteobacteria bacterium]
MTPIRHLVVVTRRDCELCEHLLGLLAPYQRAGRIALEEVDLADDPVGLAAYQWRVPVVLEAAQELLWGNIGAAQVAAALGELDAVRV